jgi:hypothetical protein
MSNSHCTHPGGPAYCGSETCPGRARYLAYKNAKPVDLEFAETFAENLTMESYEAYEIPEEIEIEISETLDYADELEFLNHGDDKHRGILTLGDLVKNPKHMRGNCLPVSEIIVENNQLSDDYKVNVAEIKYERGMHAAVEIVTPDNKVFIIDYTMRQFDADAPFPYVGQKSQWESKIDDYISSIWLDQRKQS